MHAAGIGLHTLHTLHCILQGGLYEAWAYQLERNASYKKADAVFVNGLKAVTDTETKQRLGMKQKQFQVNEYLRSLSWCLFCPCA